MVRINRRESQTRCFENGAVGGTNAAEEKCAAIEDKGRAEGTASAWVAQLVERVLGKDEVTGSIPVPGSRDCGRGIYGEPAGKFEGAGRAGVTQR